MSKKKTNIAVFSDIHANLLGLQCFIDSLKKRQIDKYIFLGDLLSYGTEPNEVIEKFLEFKKDKDFICIKGNHEVLYMQDQSSYEIKNDFVKESVLWTKKRLTYNIESCCEWLDEYIYKDIYFSHANPFGPLDWSYLRSSEENLKAIDQIKQKECNIGVFAHIHRKSIFSNNSYIDSNCYCTNAPTIVNCGSIGQPRGEGCSYLLLSLDDNTTDIELVTLEVEKSIIIQNLQKSSLSLETKERLQSFWEKK
jgi:predicted phosphodiesterase